MSEKNILEWFVKKKANTMGVDSREFLLQLYDTAIELVNTLNAMASGEIESAKKAHDRLIISQKEQNRSVDSLLVDITRGDLTISQRGDLLRYFRKAESISKFIKEAVIHVYLAIETEQKIPVELWNLLQENAKELQGEVSLLLSASESILSDPQKTKSTIERIFDTERILDDLYYSYIKTIQMSSVDSRTVFLLNEIAVAIEEAADAGQECADSLNLFIVMSGEL